MANTDNVGQDPYHVLGVPSDVDFYGVQRAYSRLAQQYKHDLSGDPAALREAFRTLNEAFSVLGVPDHRVAYDRSRGIEHVGRSRPAGGSAGAHGPLAALSWYYLLLATEAVLLVVGVVLALTWDEGSSPARGVAAWYVVVLPVLVVAQGVVMVFSSRTSPGARAGGLALGLALGVAALTVFVVSVAGADTGLAW